MKPRVLPLNRVMSLVNAVMGRLEGRIDKKLAVQIANELSTSSGAAEALAKAQATRANIGATSNKLGAALRSPIAPAAVSVTNALAPRIVIGGIGRDESRGLNALAPAR